jgi:hypothetical protein
MKDSDKRRDAAVLAGLRLLEAATSGTIDMKSSNDGQIEAVMDIATCGGEIEALSAEEIDELCMSINTGEIAIVDKVSA